MKNCGRASFKKLSAASFICSAFTLYMGLDKMFRYYNGTMHYENAYVEGDAYNYIINGNYATGFYVLTGAFALMGIGFIALWYLSKMSDMQEQLAAPCSADESSSQNTEEDISSDSDTL